MRINFQTILLVILFVTAYSAVGQALPDGPYFGQTPPGLTPQIFAPGIVSLANRKEYKVVFSPNGQECLIGIAGELLYTKQQNGHWSEPQMAAPGAGEPFFSPDGQKIFIVRGADIWVNIRVNQSWTGFQIVASPISTDAEEWHPTVTSDGTLYFCSSRDNPGGGYNIWRSKYEDGSYSTAEKLDAVINTPSYGAWDPFIAPDESYMVFSSDRPDGYGSVDQYISYHNEDDTWGIPVNLGPAINTSGIEYGSYISYDSKYYFFSRPTSFGTGGASDVYWVDARALGIPEPSTILLCLAGIGLIRRSRNRSAITQ